MSDLQFGCQHSECPPLDTIKGQDRWKWKWEWESEWEWKCASMEWWNVAGKLGFQKAGECRVSSMGKASIFHIPQKGGLGLVMGVSIDYIMVLRHKYLSKCCIFTTKLYIINIVNSINNIVSFFLCQQNRLINKTAPHLVRFNFPQSIINPHFDWRLTLSTLIWISPCQPHKYIYKYDPNPCLTSSPIKWWFLRLPDRL